MRTGTKERALLFVGCAAITGAGVGALEYAVYGAGAVEGLVRSLLAGLVAGGLGTGLVARGLDEGRIGSRLRRGEQAKKGTEG